MSIDAERTERRGADRTEPGRSRTRRPERIAGRSASDKEV